MEQLENRRVLAAVTVSTIFDVVDWDQIGGIQQLISNPGADNKISLREAVIAANQTFDGSPDTINFSTNPAYGLDGGTILLTQAQGTLTITDSVTINGSALPSGITIDAGNGTDHNFGTFDGFSIFYVSGYTAQVEINGLKLTGADSDISGGAIDAYGLTGAGASLTIKNSLITRNFGLYGSGGIKAPSCDLTVQDSTISGNTTYGGAGGGIYFNGYNKVLNVIGSTISGNNTYYQGGGIFAGYGTHVSIQSSHITGNQSTDRGGGIYLKGQHSELTLQSSEIRDNVSSNGLYGGGMYAHIDFGSITIDKTIFDNNTIAQSQAGPGNAGGGAFLSCGNNSQVTITDSTFSNNKALGDEANSGGLDLNAESNSTILLDQVTITENHADDDIGGLYMGSTEYSVITVRNTTISGNTSNNNNLINNSACGVWAHGEDGGSNIIEYSTISGNTTISPPGSANNAPGAGMHIYNVDSFIHTPPSTTTIRNTTISGNQAEGSGGGIEIADVAFGGGQVLISHSTITDNRADSDGDDIGAGGGIYVPGSTDMTVTIEDTVIAGNFRGTGSTRDDINGPVTIAWSLIGDNTGSGLAGAPVGSPDANGNVIGTSAAPIDPHLAPLAFNGGPTRTHALLPGSPAIDAGDPNFDPNSFTPPLNYDQRGEPFARKLDGDGNGSVLIDIGAFEVGPSDNVAPKVVDVLLNGVQTGGSTPWVNPISYAELVPLGKQLAPIYRDRTNQIQIVFNEDVVVDDPYNTLTLKGTGNQGALAPKTIIADDFAYDENTYTATWTFNDLGPDKYRIDLMADGVTGLDANNNTVILDGDWENMTNDTPDVFTDDPTGRPFEVGNGMPGGNFQFLFSLLPGDYNQDGVVLDSGADSDLLVVKDGNGDGIVEEGVGADDSDLVTTNGGARLQLLHADRGDYHDDEYVNSADYGTWRATFNENVDPGTGADGSGNGIIDAPDYTLWRYWENTQGAWYTGPSGLGSLLPIVDFGNAPKVADVIISGSNSTHDPYLFDDHDGSGEQLRTVPVGGADTISITFSEDVNVSASNLRVVGLATANVPTLAEFSYDMMTMTATWQFDGIMPDDIYLISLSDAITDIEGNRLDGEWVNPATTTTSNSLVSQFPSGDGESGGTFNFVFTLLAGDTDLNNYVDFTDYQMIWQYLYAHYPSGSFIQGDFNGDGVCDSADADMQLANQLLDLSTTSMLGDLNGDFKVDDSDMETLADNFGTSNPTHSDGDLNGDGQIDNTDLDLMFTQYGLELAVVS